MKKILALALSGMMLLSFTACSNLEPAKDKSQPKENNQVIGNKDVEIPSPFEEFKNLADAEKLAGFTMKLPDSMLDSFTQKLIEAVEQDMIQVTYESGEERLIIRKAKGNQDISGDYNEYAENQSITVGDKKVNTRGNNGNIQVATWLDGEFSYAIRAESEAVSLDIGAVQAMIEQIR